MDIQAFRGLRYDDPAADDSIAQGVMDLSSVIVHQHSLSRNAPVGYSAGRLLGEGSEELLQHWLRQGVLSRDVEPSLYIYRAGYRGDDGIPKQRSGVIGLVGGIGKTAAVPHLVTVVRPELEELCSTFTTQPLARATDDAGVHYRLWATTQPPFIAAVNELLKFVDTSHNDVGLMAVSTVGDPPPIGLVFAAPALPFG